MPRSFWDLFRPRPFDWLQIAVTSHCNAACAYCPHTIYRRHWQSRHLSPATFQRLLPDLKKVNLVYLQGWGEPFLHPDFFTFVSLAKEAGCRVGATTNATLLDESTLTRIVTSGLDILAFSLAGIGNSHDTWRPGTNFRQVLGVIASLQEIKRRLGKGSPRIHIAYMLLRSGLRDLARLSGALQGLGISQVVISTLDFVAAPELIQESLAILSGPERLEISARLKDLAAAASRSHLNIHVPSLSSPDKRKECPENILRAAVVSPEGGVSPCVYTNVPAQSGHYFLRGKAQPLPSLCFGTLPDHSFLEIWQQPAYRSFRQSRQRGRLTGFCRHCLKMPTD